MTQLSFILLLVCLQSFIDCRYSVDQNLHKYYNNYRFGVYENQRRTSKIVKEELFIGNKMRQIQAWIEVKGVWYI
jgi:hypothetical protein